MQQISFAMGSSQALDVILCFENLIPLWVNRISFTLRYTLCSGYSYKHNILYKKISTKSCVRIQQTQHLSKGDNSRKFFFEFLIESNCTCH